MYSWSIQQRNPVSPTCWPSWGWDHCVVCDGEAPSHCPQRYCQSPRLLELWKARLRAAGTENETRFGRHLKNKTVFFRKHTLKIMCFGTLNPLFCTDLVFYKARQGLGPGLGTERVAAFHCRSVDIMPKWRLDSLRRRGSCCACGRRDRES